MIRTPLSAAVSCLFFVGLSGLALTVRAQEAEAPSESDIAWKEGPATVDIGADAEIRVPEGYGFAEPAEARKYLERMGNPTDGTELGILEPDGGDWFVVFDFDDAGYVKDDERDSLDPDAMLRSLQEGNKESNAARKERGYPALTLVGWAVPPGFNAETKNLEWATRLEAESGAFVVNHNTRILGRRGVMRANLVVDPEDLEGVLPTYRQLMSAYAFKKGSRYSEFTSGDRIAEIGLTALVVGGAAAAATKFGLLAKFWKVIAGALVAVAAFAKKIFGAVFRRKPAASPAP